MKENAQSSAASWFTKKECAKKYLLRNMSVGAAMNSILKVHGKIRLPKKCVKKFILDIPDYSIIMFLRKYVVII